MHTFILNVHMNLYMLTRLEYRGASDGVFSAT